MFDILPWINAFNIVACSFAVAIPLVLMSMK